MVNDGLTIIMNAGRPCTTWADSVEAKRLDLTGVARAKGYSEVL